jgi:hypothetical protein
LEENEEQGGHDSNSGGDSDSDNDNNVWAYDCDKSSIFFSHCFCAVTQLGYGGEFIGLDGVLCMVLFCSCPKPQTGFTDSINFDCAIEKPNICPIA